MVEGFKTIFHPLFFIFQITAVYECKDVMRKNIEIIHEDDALIVVNKPSGMLVIPAPGYRGKTLTDRLNDDLDSRGIEVNAYPCHRLDRETSGVMVYAKGKSIQQKMMDSFKQRKVRKQYYAFVRGVIEPARGTIDSAVYNQNKHRADPAITHYRALYRHNDFSFLEVSPVTGRRNQIRIHFKEKGYPLLGERVYAFRKDFPVSFKRLALHASYIAFKHPVNGKPCSFRAPLPEDMEGFLKRYPIQKGGNYAVR